MSRSLQENCMHNEVGHISTKPHFSLKSAEINIHFLYSYLLSIIFYPTTLNVCSALPSFCIVVCLNIIRKYTK